MMPAKYCTTLQSRWSRAASLLEKSGECSFGLVEIMCADNDGDGSSFIVILVLVCVYIYYKSSFVGPRLAFCQIAFCIC